ncbi:MAG TPA: NRDE family protein, partial [bacterium]|nr:NRDE family protein [bacterium]
MCLLVVLSRVHPDHPLVIAANRDELLARAATAMTVLRESGPRILGGRDELAGGTWLAVNEHGVVAGLTNAPPGKNGRDASKRSRGALPLRLAGHSRAAEAVAAFRDEVDSGDYNPCWMLCGDRQSLAYIDLTVPATPVVESLPPGIHILENRPLHAPSPKADAVRAALAGCERWRGDELLSALERILRDHAIPAGASEVPR